MKVAFCFPGQGSLESGMGRDIAEKVESSGVKEVHGVIFTGPPHGTADLRSAMSR